MPSKGGGNHVELQWKGLCCPHPHLSLRRVGGIWSRVSRGTLPVYPLMAGIGARGRALFTLLGPERQMDSEGG